MTYRDRRYARADRLNGWADKRDAKADAAINTVHHMADMMNGTPMLPGHHSYKRHVRDVNRMDNLMRTSVVSTNMADSMRSRAANIVAAADHAIYSDDLDAVDRLTDRIAGLVARRNAIVAFNKAVRKAPDNVKALVTALPDDLRDDWGRATIYSRGPGALTFPSYVTSNLSGNINRLRKRLDLIKNPPATWFHASRRDPDVCYKCDYFAVDHTPHASVPTILMCPRD